jgi:uncharacterized protein DUF3300/endosialidase-like protein
MTNLSRQFDKICRVAVLLVLILVGLNTSSAQAEGAAQPTRTAAQLEQLVAPIALYPDAVLAQVFMASTYPLEVIEAARWSQANPDIKGQALENAMQQQSWDPSVKALTAVPQTLQMMSDKLDWTQQLGDAVLAQQADVLDAVQRLRARADNAGNLKTTDQQKVTKTPAAQAPAGTSAERSSAIPANVYTIESVNPDEYYLPIYDPGVVYGAWPYPDYEPFYWYPPGYAAGNWFSFAAGALVGAAVWGNIDWWRNRVGVNPLRYNQFNRTNIASNVWNHNPAHRGGVPYRDGNVAQRFGNQGNAAAREALRGKADAGRREIAKQGGADKLGQGAKAGQKGQAGAKAGQKGQVGAKAGQKGQAGAKAAAGSKQGAGKAASAKKGAGTKQAGSKQTGSKAAGAKKASGSQQARSRQAAQPRQASRPSPSSGGRQAAGARASTVGMGGGGRGGAGMRAGGGRGGGGGGRGGGRRSDIGLKHDIALLGHLDNGLGFYRFSYNGSDKAYVGVLAQEVQAIMPAAVVRDKDGYLSVYYNKLGLHLQTYHQWIASGARIPVTARR